MWDPHNETLHHYPNAACLTHLNTHWIKWLKRIENEFQSVHHISIIQHLWLTALLCSPLWLWIKIEKGCLHSEALPGDYLRPESSCKLFHLAVVYHKWDYVFVLQNLSLNFACRAGAWTDWPWKRGTVGILDLLVARFCMSEHVVQEILPAIWPKYFHIAMHFLILNSLRETAGTESRPQVQRNRTVLIAQLHLCIGAILDQDWSIFFLCTVRLLLHVCPDQVTFSCCYSDKLDVLERSLRGCHIWLGCQRVGRVRCLCSFDIFCCNSLNENKNMSLSAKAEWVFSNTCPCFAELPLPILSDSKPWSWSWPSFGDIHTGSW